MYYRQQPTNPATKNEPRKFVQKSWTEPEHFKRWWGPKNFTSPFCKMDFSFEYKYLSCKRSPEGYEFWNTDIYYEIVPLDRIVYNLFCANGKGNVVNATY